MKIWELSVKRPIFMSAILAGLMTVGYYSYKATPVELFPDITFPIVTVQTLYPGAGPNEVETLISKPIEEEISTLSGMKNIRSINRESVSVVVAEFNLDVDIKNAEQQVRDKVASVRNKLPDGLDDSVIRRVDPSAQPIMVLAVKSPLRGGQLYDLANEQLKPLFEQINQVGLVEVVGGRKREIQVQVDRNKLNQREMSVSQIAASLKNSGQNVPAGKVDQTKSELVFRTLGEFNTLDQIKNSLVSFYGNDVTTKLGDIAEVKDTVEDEKMRVFMDGEESLFIQIYKQSGANTVSVANAVFARVDKINAELKNTSPGTDVTVVRDMSHFVFANVIDVAESIAFGISLTVLVVFLFLGSLRSTLITGLAIPVALIGSFALLKLAGISVNIMSLLAFSLSVGLLIDDAIVVRENIFRHLEMGKNPVKAALDGTAEVGIAVVAVTLAVLAVFGPIAFLSGVVGQFFKSFGLGVCFVMVISLFDALSNAPMLSAYFGGSHESLTGKPIRWSSPVQAILILFDRLQTWLENKYETTVRVILNHPGKTVLGMLVVIFGLASTVAFIPKTFLPASDNGEFLVAMELPPGTTLDQTTEYMKKVDLEVKKNKNVTTTLLMVGDPNGKSYVGNVYVKLTKFADRSVTTSQVKDEMRIAMKPFAEAKPTVKDIDFIGAGQRPFVVNIRGQDLEEIRKVGQQLFDKLKVNPALQDPEYTDKPGLPELQIRIDKQKAQFYGVTPIIVGTELRSQVEGVVASKFRENGLEYDVRVRLKDDQRDLQNNFNNITVPNINNRPVYLKDFVKATKETGYATVNRENRNRYVSIEADVAPKGPGMGGAIAEINRLFESGEIKLPPGVTYRFVGQAENFEELGKSIKVAGMLGIIFIFLVLASLYESLVTPFTIMIVIPFAIFGGFFGLFVRQSTLDMFSMIGCVMLMGLATKNSIILVDYINHKLAEGLPLKEAIVQGSKTRLRPILMTSLALVAGMLPVAIGLNEASSQRKSLGIAVVGGVLVSTLLTLILIPAVFSAIERARQWMIKNVGSKMITGENYHAKGEAHTNGHSNGRSNAEPVTPNPQLSK